MHLRGIFFNQPFIRLSAHTSCLIRIIKHIFYFLSEVISVSVFEGKACDIIFDKLGQRTEVGRYHRLLVGETLKNDIGKIVIPL